MTKRVGVVIVTFNSAVTIAKAIASIAAADEVGTIVVVDNASTDATLERIDRDRVVLLPQRENHGFGKASNIGAAQIAEPFIAFVNPDATASPDTFSRLTEAIEEAGPATFAVGPALLNDAGERERSARRFPTIANAFFNWRYRQVFASSRNRAMTEFLMLDRDLTSTFASDWVSGAFLLCRTQDFREVGGFDEDYFLYYEDIDLCRRARERGQSAKFIGTAVAHHSIGGSSKSVSMLAGWWRVRGFLEFYRKWLRRGLGSDLAFGFLLLAGMGLEILFRLRRRVEQRPRAGVSVDR